MVLGVRSKLEMIWKFNNDDDHGAHGIDDDHPDVDCDDEKKCCKKWKEKRRSKTKVKQHLVVKVLVLVDDPNFGKGVQRRGHRGWDQGSFPSRGEYLSNKILNCLSANLGVFLNCLACFKLSIENFQTSSEAKVNTFISVRWKRLSWTPHWMCVCYLNFLPHYNALQ